MSDYENQMELDSDVLQIQLEEDWALDWGLGLGENLDQEEEQPVDS